MALLDVTGGALLTRLYRSGGLSPLALGLMGVLAWRAYQKKDRLADMFGGAMGGISKIPAMLLARTDTQEKPARKTRSRRRTPAKSASGRKRRTTQARSSRAAQANGAATVH
jgi:hypothetical protein